uniref:Gonadoliberin-3 n=2 Tax=Clupeocephala TaxID=186625 RepID=GON3_CLUPA|nr:RecName: Full=Gonadoliberin-3; AltName: Full=Gonadoliberin III; AltName: Full=Gonadotropin-releasing hormone III; Short=GnRH-III; AltName: Full=Luliberin III; AltName: Full=Luteinizing hormone-releasing hormone III; Short=LH-RH III [Oncorhynchus keta]P69106.1 RecName: Full=Gonadoliberin-3; AltName: Full=Gonadoliberin III; AltName: Full=Gonadotropin-releasing hormone III; Short=GnRH-III; AltName: Full=Luliberin III; AltName: Full=Luteinizing hormone-releasing hormone III; Short=LH-RH III [Clupea
QHWSYGWLPG